MNPLFLASGQGILPFVIFGIPAALASLASFIIFAVLTSKKDKKHDRRAVASIIAGVGFAIIAYYSPGFEFFADWLAG